MDLRIDLILLEPLGSRFALMLFSRLIFWVLLDECYGRHRVSSLMTPKKLLSAFRFSGACFCEIRHDAVPCFSEYSVDLCECSFDCNYYSSS